jgi:pantetheine-phosphate adenylyltransferase
MKIAVYPGSFDPVTYGHLDLIRRGLTIADRLIIAVLGNTTKDPLFTVDERLGQVRRAVKGYRRVSVVSFNGLLVDFIRRTRVNFVIRGLRAVSDFEYEFQMALMNRRLNEHAETVFLTPAEPYTYLSSRVVKEIARFNGDIGGLVPPHVAAALRNRFRS